MIRRFIRRNRPLGCAEVAELLQSYLDGEVDDLTARRLAAHLDDCRRCGLEAATYREIKASLARRDEPLPDGAVRRLRDFAERLLRDNDPPVTGSPTPA